jgi:hypothetical protein
VTVTVDITGREPFAMSYVVMDTSKIVEAQTRFYELRDFLRQSGLKPDARKINDPGLMVMCSGGFDPIKPRAHTTIHHTGIHHA